MAEHARHFVSRSAAATEALGEALGRLLPTGAVLALHGEMGTGKTTLVRGLARGLGVEGPVTSPTFVLMQEYAGRERLYHFDAWMDGREALFLEGGGADYLGGDGVAVIEWAERVERFLPRPHLTLRLDHVARAGGAAVEERALGLGLVAGAAEDPLGVRLAALVKGLPVPAGVEERPKAAAD